MALMNNVQMSMLLSSLLGGSGGSDVSASDIQIRTGTFSNWEDEENVDYSDGHFDTVLFDEPFDESVGSNYIIIMTRSDLKYDILENYTSYRGYDINDVITPFEKKIILNNSGISSTVYLAPWNYYIVQSVGYSLSFGAHFPTGFYTPNGANLELEDTYLINDKIIPQYFVSLSSNRPYSLSTASTTIKNGISTQPLYNNVISSGSAIIPVRSIGIPPEQDITDIDYIINNVLIPSKILKQSNSYTRYYMNYCSPVEIPVSVVQDMINAIEEGYSEDKKYSTNHLAYACWATPNNMGVIHGMNNKGFSVFSRSWIKKYYDIFDEETLSSFSNSYLSYFTNYNYRVYGDYTYTVIKI